MIYPVRPIDAANIAAATVELGGTVPDALGRVIALYNASRGELDPNPGPAVDPEPTSPADALDGGTLTLDNLGEITTTWASWHVRIESVRAARDTLENRIEKLLQPMFDGSIADELVDSLKPVAEPHLEILRSARAAGITEHTTADHVINAPAEMRAHWNDAETAARKLDEMHRRVMSPLVCHANVLGHIRAEGGAQRFTYVMWNIGSDGRHRALGLRACSHWLKCIGDVRLLNPTEARDVIGDFAYGPEQQRPEWWIKELARMDRDAEERRDARRAAENEAQASREARAQQHSRT